MKQNIVVFMCQLNGPNHANLSFETSTVSIGCCVILVTTSQAGNPSNLGSMGKRLVSNEKNPLLHLRWPKGLWEYDKLSMEKGRWNSLVFLRGL